ncbi:MAG: hypothetical protein SFV19_05635 [Rhodospirillaceae bacterium]|nr:hypothetical protein [Rhodospirillaceae bacterium]
MTNDPSATMPAPWWRSGKLVVLGLALALIVGWFFYRATVPPPWMRAFGEEIATRAAADPEAPLPEDTREATPRGPVDNPLICFARAAKLPWDRVVFVTHAQAKTGLADHPTLGGEAWAEAARTAAATQLAADDRYQLIVLMNAGSVVDRQLFYTFWGDLSALARPEGFTPETAIFTAASRGGRYVLAVAAAATPADCPK